MRLLICTQTVDSQDSNLGFFHRWIEEFAKHCDEVLVICLREGAHVLPKNVRVLSLGKEKGSWRVVRALHFLRYIRQYRNEYDAVFVHMNPEYILLGGHLWRRWHKKIGLWYAHRSVTWKLGRALRLVDRVFTSSESGFRIPSPKVLVVGQGIDTELFKPDIHMESTEIRILTVGRIARSKRILEMLQMLDVLHAQKENFTFTIVGEATTDAEEIYAREVRAALEQRPYKNKVRLYGPVAHHQLPEIFHAHDVCLNLSATGSMDKAVLEALACGVPVLCANEAYRDLLSPFGLYVSGADPTAAAHALEQFLARPDRPAMIATLHNKVAAEHSLARLIPAMLKELA